MTEPTKAPIMSVTMGTSMMAGHSAERMLVEPRIKFFVERNSNTMGSHRSESTISAALSHFICHHARGDRMLVDIKGGIENDVISSLWLRFGCGDVGAPGIETFFQTHKVLL